MSSYATALQTSDGRIVSRRSQADREVLSRAPLCNEARPDTVQLLHANLTPQSDQRDIINERQHK